MTNVSDSPAFSKDELERLERLAEAASEVEPWIPEKRGDTLTGRVLRWETGHQRGDPTRRCEVIVVRTAKGDRGFYTWHAQARYKLILPKAELESRRDPMGLAVPHEERLGEAGDFVAIVLRGLSTMDDGNEAASYNVAIEKGAPGPDEESSRDDALPEGF